MDKLKTVKAMITGMFNRNYDLEFESVDDSEFLQIIKTGMEKVEEADPGVFDELLEHAVEEYTQVWFRLAKEDKVDFDEQEERKEARKTFLEFFHGEES
ncbi:MAG: hypothetical protein GY737_15630 [Desulfobacteraceae bacterium]|nr:hypothetical protein [Desulfobacteraceae bacterium]